MKDYIAQALSTKSDSWHGEKVDGEYARSLMEDFTYVGDRLDALKKFLFYGKEDNMLEAWDGDPTLKDFHEKLGPNGIDIIHAILGLATESVECIEALLKDEIDVVNLKEEGGDILWYLAILFNATNTDFETEMARNIAKLRKRFPEKFTEYDAQNRNLDSERAVLETDFKKEEN